MPRSLRPFSDRAYPDPDGNVTPYDSPAVGVLLEVSNTERAWPVQLVNDVLMELLPFEAQGYVSYVAEATVPDPRQLLPANPRRGALTIWSVFTSNADGFRVARSRDDALRDDTSLVFSASAFATWAVRFAWPDPVWVQQRSAPGGGVLSVQTEDWAR